MEHALAALVQAHGTPLVAGLAAVECIGLPAPAAAALATAAIYAGSSGSIDIATLLLGAFTGGVLGQIGGYALGRSLGLAALHRWGYLIGLSPDRLLLGRYLFRLHGGKVVVLGRLVSVLRMIGGPLAGVNAMPLGRFLLANASGAAIWTGLYGYGGYRLGAGMRRIAGPVGLVLGALVLIGIGVGFVVLRRHETRLIARARQDDSRGWSLSDDDRIV